MINCDHKLPSTKRKKRAVTSNLSPKVPFDVSLVPTKLPDPIVVTNKSQYDKFIFHELNTSIPLKPVQIYIKHNLSFSLWLSVGINKKPTDDQSFLNYTVNETQSALLSVEELSNFINESMN